MCESPKPPRHEFEKLRRTCCRAAVDAQSREEIQTKRLSSAADKKRDRLHRKRTLLPRAVPLAARRRETSLLAKTTSEALGFDDAQKAKVQQFFSDPRTPTDAVHCLPFYRLFANYEIGSLSKLSPYSAMTVKFQLDKTEVDEALKEIGPELAAVIYDKTQDPAFSAVVNFYMQRDEFKKAHEMLIAENFAYPGQYTSHRNLARFCAKFTELIDQAEAHYRLAYLFSGKDPEVHQEMVEFLAQNNRKEALLQ